MNVRNTSVGWIIYKYCSNDYLIDFCNLIKEQQMASIIFQTLIRNII